jgi:hypothetical protein
MGTPARKKPAKVEVAHGAVSETWDVGEVDPKGPFSQQRWDDNSSIRGYLATAATLIFAGTVAWACYQAGGSHWTQAKELLQILLPCETGFLGGAISFYYAKK